jgi:VanZ family protein
MKRILGTICVLVICGILAAGLWPFNFFRKNKVTWVRGENGLEFGENATIYSRGSFEVSNPDEKPGCSLEVWLQPGAANWEGSATILGFYTPHNPLQFRLRQEAEVLRLKRDYRDRQKNLLTSIVDVEHAFRPAELALFTITSNRKATSVYRNGALMNVFSRDSLSCQDFSGQLVIGGSPIAGYRTWQGKLLGLAIYKQELTSEQVLRHYAMWTQKAAAEEFRKDGTLALYSFAERSGRIVHNSIGSKPDLYIPRIYAIPHKKMLAPPWEEFSPRFEYVSDILINVAGFVPLGFFLCAYFTWDRQWNRAAIVTILLGGLISFTIEILQSFIPARMSGVTDIITNTLGTALGVILWRCRPVQTFAAKLRRPGSSLLELPDKRNTA